MNRVFDYNGIHVSPSKPVRALKTVKKTLLIDSADRDKGKFFTNGDFVAHLPRVYENVVSLRLMAAEFPPFVSQGQAGALIHSYADGQNNSSANWSADTTLSTAPNTFYFLVDLQGLNKTDECSVSSNRSGFPDSYYAKIPALASANNSIVSFIEYNDHSGQENVARFTPAIGKLDRLHIRTRLHSQQGGQGFIYWTGDGTVGSIDNRDRAEFSLSFEIEYLDNVFDDFSSIETRVSDRG